MITISVILAVHNPIPRFLEAALGALRSQTLSPSRWELCLVDNGSQPALDSWVDLAWHPGARIVREETLGLTPARLRGIRETTGSVLVFVDDDNVLAADYLSVVERIARERPTLGAWGGRVMLEFTSPPPEWTRQYWSLLAHRDFEQDQITGQAVPQDPMPVGAGMCVRRAVAESYARQVVACDLRSGLDRRGRSLLSAGDSDLVLTASDLGMERGCFKDLQLQHLIAPHRLTVEYLANLSEEMLYSDCLLQWIRNPGFEPPRTGWLWRLQFGWMWLTKFGRKRHFHRATKRAQWRFRRLWEERGNAPPKPVVR